jgi:stage II sporulation protein P
LFFYRKKISLNKFGNRRSKLYSLLGIGLLFILGLIILVNTYFYHDNLAIPVTTKDPTIDSSPLILEIGKLMRLLNISELKMQQILGEGCPLVIKPISNELDSKINVLNLLAKGLAYITDLNSNDPTTIFKSQMAVFASAELTEVTSVKEPFSSDDDQGEEDFYLETPPGLDDWDFEFDQNEPVELSKDPVVLIYNTHNAETYLPTDGKSKLEGRNAGVVSVAKALEQTLEGKYGLKTIRSEVIHDYPDWARSYIKSLQTAQKLLKTNKTIRAVFDIHRDAGFKDKSTTTIDINGKKAASIMIVIGTEHQRWRQNLAFAEKLEVKANLLYPGLIRDIRIRNNRRYNQHLHPNALILEVGSDLNTLKEAQYSASLFARVITEVIKDMSH